MLHRLVAIMIVLMCFSATAWASDHEGLLGNPESTQSTLKSLPPQAKLSLEQAIKIALTSVPGGKAYAAWMTKKSGHIVYKIEIEDPSQIAHEVYVEDQSGVIVARPEHLSTKDLYSCDTGLCGDPLRK